jgi:hypothetical protein
MDAAGAAVAMAETGEAHEQGRPWILADPGNHPLA